MGPGFKNEVILIHLSARRRNVTSAYVHCGFQPFRRPGFRAKIRRFSKIPSPCHLRKLVLDNGDILYLLMRIFDWKGFTGLLICVHPETRVSIWNVQYSAFSDQPILCNLWFLLTAEC